MNKRVDRDSSVVVVVDGSNSKLHNLNFSNFLTNKKLFSNFSIFLKSNRIF